MPTENANPEAILEAIKKIEIVTELLEEKNKNNLKMIVEGKVSGDKQIGPYARLLTYAPGEVIIREGEWGGNTFYLSVEGDLHVLVADESGENRKLATITPGTSFGERSILAGLPRNATVRVPEGSDPATVLELVRPALRLLRSLKRFAERIDDTYRTHGLGNTIAAIHEEAGDALSAIELVQLGNLAHFMVYGKHHLLVEEGKPIEKLLLIRGGWVRRVRGVPIYQDITESAGPSTLVPEDFLGAGNCLGLEALAGQSAWGYSAALMSRTEVLEIPLAELRQDRQLCDRVQKAFAAFSVADDDTSLRARAEHDVLTAAEKEIATGIVDAVNLLVMDMDKCVRCGNCSLACHRVHGQSRLLRRGIHIERPIQLGSTAKQHVLAPSVCMHCKDPECLTGCPTGAIFRDPMGQVDIDQHTCIGCFDCATQCPYNAISMVPRDAPATGALNFATRLKNLFSVSAAKPAPAAAAEAEDMVAIKCNLCQSTPLNPNGARRPAYSCEENCPTGALVRVNPQEYFGEVEKTLGLVFRDQTHAIGRNIHKSDPIARAWHFAGAGLVIAVTAIIGWALWRYGFSQPLRGTWLTMRWVTGLVGLVGIAAVMTYPARKPIYRKRAGALRYWLLAHMYLGALAGIVLLLHGGSHGGSLLTTVLMLWFDAVIFTGLFGMFCYLVVPRIMTSIEGDPLLIEDLAGRRTELRAELASILSKGDDELRELINRRVRRHCSSLSYLLSQYLRREELTSSLAKARLHFKSEMAALTDKEKRSLFLKAVERSVTLRRVDSLIYLHRMLKVWLGPHVISTSVMLALMVAHIVQVVFFKVR